MSPGAAAPLHACLLLGLFSFARSSALFNARPSSGQVAHQSEETLGLFSSSAEPLNRYPVVGVLSQPGDGLDSCRGPCKRPGLVTFEEGGAGGGTGVQYSLAGAGVSYVAASYVKFVEAGGARVVPIIYNRPWSEILLTLRSVNGLLLPGGSANKTGLFLRRVKQLLQAAMDFNDKGEYFPVLAECLSFEMLAMVISKEGRDVLERFDATHPSTLRFAGEWAKRRNLFQWMPLELVEKLQTHNLSMQNHKSGLSPSRLLSDPDLASFFTILTTTLDESGKEYVSTVEAREYPFTALQWHPEKNAFEWGSPLYPHTTEGVQVTAAAAIFFVNEARKSQHTFKPQRRLRDLAIYNYNPTYSGSAGPGHFTQVYTFLCHNFTAGICSNAQDKRAGGLSLEAQQ